MKNIRSKKPHYFIVFFILVIATLFAFKNTLFHFLISNNILISYLQKLSIDEFIETTNFNKNVSLLNISNLIDDKQLFEQFKYNKRNKNKKSDIFPETIKDETIISIEDNNLIQKKIRYKLSNNNKDFIETSSIIFFPNESISCDCYDLIKNKTLVFENKGIAANKNETESILTFTFDNDKKEEFKIKNSQFTKIKIPSNYNTKLVQISWTKNSSGFLIFHGSEKESITKKTLFITINSNPLSNDFYIELKNLFKNGSVFYNNNSFPIATEYKENVISLEANNSLINNGYTYKSKDIFFDNQKNLYKLLNSNFKSLLRINVIQPTSSAINEDFSNTQVLITRKKSLSNIPDTLHEIINKSNFDFIRINIDVDNFSEKQLLKIFKKVDNNTNIFMLLGKNYSFNEQDLKADQSILAIINDESRKNLLEPLNNIKENTPLQQNLLIQLIHTFVKNTGSFNYKPNNLITIQSSDDEYFIFNNNNYFSSKKFYLPIENYIDNYKKIEEEREKYQIRDLSFSIFNFKNAKLKLTAKDKITRCFSDKNLKIWQIYFDSKTESYIADLKIQSDSVIEEIQVNCLLYSEHFTNNYQIEFTKDNKPLEQLQFRVGEFLLRPNSHFISQNLFTIDNSADFSVLKSYNEHNIFTKNNEIDLILFSHYYPKIQKHLEHYISYKEKK